jgi:regulatory protein
MARITALKAQKKNQDRVNVYLDGRFGFGLPAIVAASLKLGQVLSAVELEAIREQGSIEEAYGRALNYLSYRPRSQAEVTAYLQRRGAPQSQIAAVISRLERIGLIDDEAFAQFWVENRERFRPRGLRALRFELHSKGIDDQAIDQALAAVDASASAYEAASKKARQLRNADKEAFYRKLVDYLARRGFDYEVAREATERHWAALSIDE